MQKVINEKDFKEMAKETLIVQFSATWCAPCKVLTKTIDDNYDKLANSIYKMDIDDNASLVKVLGIRSVPTIIRFENGQETGRLVGMQKIENIAKLAS